MEFTFATKTVLSQQLTMDNEQWNGIPTELLPTWKHLKDNLKDFWPFKKVLLRI